VVAAVAVDSMVAVVADSVVGAALVVVVFAVAVSAADSGVDLEEASGSVGLATVLDSVSG
jgi:hypothetical protein